MKRDMNSNMANINIPENLKSAIEEDIRLRHHVSSVDEAIEQLIQFHLSQLARGEYGKDSLTKCLTRHRLKKDLRSATWGTSWTDDSKYEENFLCIDIDKFKKYLDIHNFVSGDRVLISIASQLQEHYGDDDVYRWGGDEFVVFLNNRDPWVPNPSEVTLNHAIVRVNVDRNQWLNDSLNEWILLHIDAGRFIGTPDGADLGCLTPVWMKRKNKD